MSNPNGFTYQSREELAQEVAADNHLEESRRYHEQQWREHVAFWKEWQEELKSKRDINHKGEK